MNRTGKSPRRALMLAGGGVKVAYQAGVLEVWLDEAGLQFDLADGSSGGVFNLAMWVQGMTGRRMADNWRNLDPRVGVDFNWTQYTRLFYAESLFELGGYRKHVFSGWGLDFDIIRESTREATFNAYNFTKHQIEPFTPDQMTPDHLAACVSLPMWFPPVNIGGQTYIDSVFVTDCNLEEAIRRGADELWIVWTVSERGEWNDGFVANYFQIVEAAAVGNLKRVLARIEASNLAIERGEPGEFGRSLTVKILKGEVPMHYLINFSQDRVAEAVNLGVRDARQWCQEQDISLKPSNEYSTDLHTVETKLSFSEHMKGYFSMGETDPEAGFRLGKQHQERLSCELTIRVDGINRFLTRPEHEASADGFVICDALGGKLAIETGVFNLFVHERDPRRKRMLYRLFFYDSKGVPLTFSGFKQVEDDPGLDAWEDTTTLYVRILRGHLQLGEEEGAEIIAAGVLKLHLLDFLKELTTFRTEGPTLSDRASALMRFGRSFFGKLWDVYASQILSSGPV
jgi:predicted acylesterase/phospholipase RssA